MKIQQLREQNDNEAMLHAKLVSQYKQVAETYPIIRFVGIHTNFINNLPVDITEQQLHKLVKLSFTPERFKMLAKLYPSQNYPRVTIVQFAKAGEWFEEMADYGYGPEHRVKSWKEMVEKINEYIAEESDFEP